MLEGWNKITDNLIGHAARGSKRHETTINMTTITNKEKHQSKCCWKYTSDTVLI